LALVLLESGFVQVQLNKSLNKSPSKCPLYTKPEGKEDIKYEELMEIEISDETTMFIVTILAVLFCAA